jgi:muramoyltetrapeptide carboxypeptidase
MHLKRTNAPDAVKKTRQAPNSAEAADASFETATREETSSMPCRILPPSLQPGARIGLIAPSSPVYEEENRQKAIRLLEEMGFTVIAGQSCYEQRGYLSGSDSLRAYDVNSAFANPDIDAIVCLRGGYGAARLLPMLDYDMIRNHPKPFVGFSDITALHCAFQVKCGLVTFHGPMAGAHWQVGLRENNSRSGWLRAMSDTAPLGMMENPDGTPFEAFREGEAEGVLLGGNLTVLNNLLGTEYMPDLNGKILLLEDVGEKPYRVDAMLTQFRNAGVLQKCAGFILGDFTDCGGDPSKPSLTLQEIFSELLPSDKPVLSSVHAGHGHDKITLPLNIPYRISGSTLTALASATIGGASGNA